MRKSRYTETPIIGLIKAHEAGMPTAEVCRKLGLSQGTFYKFKPKHEGMSVSDAAKRRRGRRRAPGNRTPTCGLRDRRGCQT